MLFLYRENQRNVDLPKIYQVLEGFFTLWTGEALAFIMMRGESRFTLANSQTEFRAQSFANMLRITLGVRSTKRVDAWGGFRGTFGLAGLQTIFFWPYLQRPLVWHYEMITPLYMILTYPLMTAIRRLQCQSLEPGMIPPRYSGVSHALKLIFKEEGFRGLYRGFGAATVASLITLILAKSPQNRFE